METMRLEEISAFSLVPVSIILPIFIGDEFSHILFRNEKAISRMQIAFV